MNRQGLVKNIFSVGSIQILNYVFPIITVPIISRIIGPEKFGVINFAAAFVGYFTLFIGYGFDLTATRKLASDPSNVEKRNDVFSKVFFSQIFLFIISSAIFLFFLFFLPQLRDEKIVAIFTFSACLGTVFTQNWLFQAMQELSKIAILNLVSKVIFTVLIILTIREASDYIWQPLAVSIATIFIGTMSLLWSIKKYSLKLHHVRISSCIKMLWEEKTFFLSLVIINLYTGTNVVILGIFQTSTEVGYYSAGQKLIAIFQGVVSLTLSQAFFPFIAKSFGESFERGLEVSQKLLPMVLVLTFFVGIVFYFAGPFALTLLYGDAFKPAIIVFRILAFSPLIISFSTVVGIHIMLNLKMDRAFFKVSCLGAIFSIASNILLVKKMGSVGSAYTLLLTELLVAILFYLCLKRRGIEVINAKYFRFSNLKVFTSFKG